MAPNGWPLEAERDFWRAACAPGTPHSLWWFVRLAWGTEWYFRDTGKTRWLTRRVHKPFVDWYQSLVEEWLVRRRRGEIKRSYALILIPRNCGKTLTITQAASIWAHLADRNLALYIGSETHPKAQTFLSSLEEVIGGKDEYAWFQWLYGSFRDPRRNWSKKECVTAFRSATGIKEPTFGTYGLEMGITGMHPDMVVFDDPLSLETLSALTLAAAKESYDSIHPAMRSDSLFVGNMTRYAASDVAGHIIAQEGIASWNGLPPPDPQLEAAVAKGGGKVHVYFLQGRDGRKKSEEHPKGEPVIPEVWDKDAMDHYELKDPVNFASQVMNTPNVGEHMPLEFAQLEKVTISREDLPQIDFATVHLDTAFKDEKLISAGCSNVIVGCLHSLRDDGKVFVDRVIRNQKDRSEQFINRLTSYLLSLQARGYRLKCITDEAEAWGKKGTFKQLLQVSLSMAGFRIGPDMILTFNRTNKKEVRLRKAASYWAEGYGWIIKGIENEDRLKYELVNLTKGDQCDVADALADVWNDGVWKRPQPRTPESVDTVPIQPGDEGLRPGVLGDYRYERRAEYDPIYMEGGEGGIG